MLKRFLTAVVGLALVLGEAAATPADAADPIPLVTGQWPPYSGPDLEGNGVAVELVRAVFVEMGRTAEIDFYPWRRCEAYVRHGMAWATFPYAVTGERQAQYLFSDPIFVGESVLFYYGDKMKSLEFDELADLRPYTVGAAAGYWYEELFRDTALKVDVSLDDLSGLKKLQTGRIDLYPVEKLVGLWLIDNHFAEDRSRFGFLEKPLRQNRNALMVSRSYPDSEALLRDFNEALKRTRDKGIHRRIMAQYGLDSDATLLK